MTDGENRVTITVIYVDVDERREETAQYTFYTDSRVTYIVYCTTENRIERSGAE